MTPIYLDHASTSPLLPEVLDSMMPYFGTSFGNPSSVHTAGRKARHALDSARESVAVLLGAKTEEIVFTSGGTEANYLAIQGCAKGGTVLTTSAEHKAILQPIEALGLKARVIPPDPSGRANPDDVRTALDGVSLASFMLVNNELGSVNDVPELAKRCHEAGSLIHCDAVQAPVSMQLDVNRLGVDLLTLSAHKMGGPKGAGLLFVRSGVPFSAPMPGGGQEQERRGGTENVAGIVGFATALRLLEERLVERRDHLVELNRRMRSELAEHLGPSIRFNTPKVGAAPHILNVGLPGLTSVQGSEMVVLGMDLDGIAVSAGSACSSGVLTPSHVLEAIGRSGDGAVRFSFGASTTVAEISRATAVLGKVIARVKSSA